MRLELILFLISIVSTAQVNTNWEVEVADFHSSVFNKMVYENETLLLASPSSDCDLFCIKSIDKTGEVQNIVSFAHNDSVIIKNFFQPAKNDIGITIVSQCETTVANSEIFFTQYDELGNVLNVAFEQEDFFFDIIRQYQKDNSGNHYFATEDEFPDLAVSKFDSDNQFMWTFSKGEEAQTDIVYRQIRRMIVDSNEDVYLGYIERLDNDETIVVTKIKQNGLEDWTYQLNKSNLSGIYLEEIKALFLDQNNDVIIAGNSIISNNVTGDENKDIWIQKIDTETGALLWDYQFDSFWQGNSLDNTLFEVKIDSYGDIVCSVESLSGSNTIFYETKEILKISNEGNLLWQLPLNKEYHTFFFSNTCHLSANCKNTTFQLDKKDQVYLLGEYPDSSKFVTKISPEGDVIWESIFMLDEEIDFFIEDFFIDEGGRIYLFGVNNINDHTYLVQLLQDPKTGLPNLVNNDFSLKASPNPFTHQLNLQTTAQIKNLHIYNTTGQLIHSATNVSGSGLDMNTAQWQTGVYFVAVELEDGQVFREKVVKF